MSDTNPQKNELIHDLFELYADEVYRFAYYMLRDVGDAKDVVQEVFLRVVRSIDTYQREASYRTWIWRITRNYVFDILRRKRKVRIQTFAAVPEPKDRSAYDTYGFELESMLIQLEPIQQEVLLLRFEHDLDIESIARVMDWPPTRVRNTIHRAVKKLRAIHGATIVKDGIKKEVES